MGVYISIHALLAESDLFLRSGPMTRRYFYPRSPCGERRHCIQRSDRKGRISIHALLAESDLFDEDDPDELWSISIHALLAESDDYYRRGEGVGLAFLSTLSLRRAT